MKFKQQTRDDPEINLIPFIDVLLVIIIFLMLTTTYNRISVLQIQLPSANSQQQETAPKRVDVEVSAGGIFTVNGVEVSKPTVDRLSDLLKQATGNDPASVVVINADGNAPHQTVVNVMDAANQAGLTRITVTTRSRPQH